MTQFLLQEKNEEICLSPMIKPLHPQKNTKCKVTTQKRHQKFRLHNDCGPTKDGQLEQKKKKKNSHPTGVIKPVNG